MKRLGLGAFALVIAGGFAYAMWPKPVPVDVAKITHAPMTVTIDEEGKTRIRDVYVVSAPIGGRVLRSPLHAGDALIAGETEIASILPSAPPLLDQRSRAEIEQQVGAARAAVTLAEAELGQARSEIDLAEVDLRRSRTLARKGVISEQTLDRAERDARVRQDAVKRAEAALEMRMRELASAEARLIEPGGGAATGVSYRPIIVRAPASGRVLRVVAESEQDVAMGAPLAETGDPGDLEIVVELLSQDAVRIREGATATIDGWGGSTLPASVRRIEPMGFTKVSALGIEEQRVRTTLDFTGPAEPRSTLGHDFRIVARISVWQSDAALVVPLGALFRDQDRWAVFKVEGSRATLAHVEIGHRNSEVADVISGLTEGDVVVLHPSDRIENGVRVEVR